MVGQGSSFDTRNYIIFESKYVPREFMEIFYLVII